MLFNKAKKIVVFFTTMIFIVICFNASIFQVSANTISCIDIQEPQSGVVVSGFIPVLTNCSKKNVSLVLRVIETSGNAYNHKLYFDDGAYRVNLDTRTLDNGTYFLYVIDSKKQKSAVDSPIISIVVDNTQTSLQAIVSSKLVRSGTTLDISLRSVGTLQNVQASIDESTTINMYFDEKDLIWTTKYFVPYTMTEGTHIVKINSKDQRGNTIQCDTVFMVCNSEPFFTSPTNDMFVLSEEIVLKGIFAPGNEVYLYQEKQNNRHFISKVKADISGVWISEPVILENGVNRFLAFANSDPEAISVFSSQKTTLKHYKNGLVVLNYHDICENGNIFSRDPKQFEADMIYLKENGFSFVSPTLYFSHINGKADLPKKPVLITFDDGLAGAYKFAYSIMKKLNIEGFFFLLVSRVGTTSNYVTWEQCREMQSSRVFCMESHTLNSHYFVDNREGRHAALISRLPLPDGTVETPEQYLKRVSEDLLISKQIIEEETQKKVNFLAIPFGYGNNDLNKIVRNQGYKGTFNSGGGVNVLPLKDGWSVKRITIKKNDDLSEILF
ncbi:MAG: polysaccharide deacetylase family protein [Caldisericia bacterium]|nr:polysaccharide deacetylase family protein [Caldisericia bacterium]